MAAEEDRRDSFEWAGVRYEILLSGEATGGAMAIFECLAPPGSGPPLHVHRYCEEVHVVREGRMRFLLDGETFDRGPGGTVFIPRGRAHTFQVMGRAPARHTVVVTPGGIEKFFVEMAKLGAPTAENRAAVVLAATRHDLEYVGPPLPTG